MAYPEGDFLLPRPTQPATTTHDVIFLFSVTVEHPSLPPRPMTTSPSHFNLLDIPKFKS
ncbi:protein of unknown function (plasmid) [Cupriavidus taiwanensis]|nr:protein of unknown function [Cupriavidus taiwanensis]SOZ72028.1 protein of unknown function [Cupriavidus taiwanensis]